MERFQESEYAVPYPIVELLRKVQKQILDKPASYYQSSWIEDSPSSPCGTVACIAGWMVALHTAEQGIPLPEVLDSLKRNDKGGNYIRTGAWELLGKPDLADLTLFSATPQLDWMEPFRTQWQERLLPQNEIAAARIEHYIRTGK